MLKKIGMCALIALVTGSPLLAQTSERADEGSMPPDFAVPGSIAINYPVATTAHLNLGFQQNAMVWRLKLWTVRPGGGVTKDTIVGFATQGECNDYGARYKEVEYRWQVEYLCETGW